MPRITVSDATMNGANGDDLPVKIIEADAIDGITTSIVVPEAQALELGEHLVSTIKAPAESPETPEQAEVEEVAAEEESDG